MALPTPITATEASSSETVSEKASPTRPMSVNAMPAGNSAFIGRRSVHEADERLQQEAVAWKTKVMIPV